MYLICAVVVYTTSLWRSLEGRSSHVLHIISLILESFSEWYLSISARTGFLSKWTVCAIKDGSSLTSWMNRTPSTSPGASQMSISWVRMSVQALSWPGGTCLHRLQHCYCSRSLPWCSSSKALVKQKSRAARLVSLSSDHSKSSLMKMTISICCVRNSQVRHHICKHKSILAVLAQWDGNAMMVPPHAGCHWQYHFHLTFARLVPAAGLGTLN